MPNLHQFLVGKRIYGEPEPDSGEFGGPLIEDERKAKLNRVAPNEGDKFLYEYDLGDGWVHEVVVDKITDPKPGVRYPVCVAGERACPPEDCGGPSDNEDMLEALANPDHPEHEDIVYWLGGEDFDPEAFDMDRANAVLWESVRFFV